MKSFHSNARAAKELFSSFFELTIRPSKVTDRIVKGKPDLLAAFIVVVLSGLAVTLGAFIAGGTALEIYQYQISTFLIELLTTPSPSPASITTLDYTIALLKDIAFFVKMWLVISMLLFVFIKLFHGKVGLTDTLVISAWTTPLWGLGGFLLGSLSLLAKPMIPLLYHYVFIFGLAALVLVIAPAVFIRALVTSSKIPIYKVTVSYLLSLFTLYVVLTLNHPDVLFYIVG